MVAARPLERTLVGTHHKHCDRVKKTWRWDTNSKTITKFANSQNLDVSSHQHLHLQCKFGRRNYSNGSQRHNIPHQRNEGMESQNIRKNTQITPQASHQRGGFATVTVCVKCGWHSDWKETQRAAVVAATLTGKQLGKWGPRIQGSPLATPADPNWDAAHFGCNRAPPRLVWGATVIIKHSFGVI